MAPANLMKYKVHTLRTIYSKLLFVAVAMRSGLVHYTILPLKESVTCPHVVP